MSNTDQPLQPSIWPEKDRIDLSAHGPMSLYDNMAFLTMAMVFHSIQQLGYSIDDGKMLVVRGPNPDLTPDELAWHRTIAKGGMDKFMPQLHLIFERKQGVSSEHQAKLAILEKRRQLAAEAADVQEQATNGYLNSRPLTLPAEPKK